MGKIFGTFGARGVYPEEINEEFAYRMGRAFGSFLGGEGLVVAGRDTRRSGQALLNAAIAGLVSSGIDVVNFGIVPTPLVQFGARKLKASGGLVVTASHNPPQYNGIKLLEGNGMGLSREKERIVEEIFLEGKFGNRSWKSAGRVFGFDVKVEYFRAVMERVNAEVMRGSGLTVLVDEGGGAGSFVLPELLETLGIKVISINSHGSGFFSARNPEPNEENLRDLQKIVGALKPDLTVAQDGDADRAVFLKNSGEIVQGDKTFALVAKFELEKKRGPIVTTVATSDVLDDIAREFGVEVYRTKVGDLVVTGKLLEVGGVVGGEENGGVIFPDLVLGRDGIFTTVRILEAMAERRRAFEELLDELPKTYQLKRKIRVEGDRKRLVEEFARKMEERGFEVDRTDGAKVRFEDGWVLVRASGTEPIIRIFSESRVEGKEKEYNDLAISFLEGRS